MTCVTGGRKIPRRKARRNYSYANNNPLTFVDPSGFDAIADPGEDGGGGGGGGFGGYGDIGGGGIDMGNIDPGAVPTLPPIAGGAPGTYTGSNIPGVNGFGEASCIGNCAGFNSTYLPNVSFATGSTTVQSDAGTSTRYNTEVYAGFTQDASTFQGSFWDDGSWHPVDGDISFSFSNLAPDPGAVLSVAGPVEYAAFGVAGLLRSAAAETGSVFWTGNGTRAVADSWASANGGQTLSMSQFAVGEAATPQAVQSASLSFAQSASGNVTVFQSASFVPVNSIWATTEYPALLANPNVTGITFNILDNSGATIGSIFCPK
jgi:hypothetical protein